jgi:hypothetical protein
MASTRSRVPVQSADEFPILSSLNFFFISLVVFVVQYQPYLPRRTRLRAEALQRAGTKSTKPAATDADMTHKGR